MNKKTILAIFALFLVVLSGCSNDSLNSGYSEPIMTNIISSYENYAEFQASLDKPEQKKVFLCDAIAYAEAAQLSLSDLSNYIIEINKIPIEDFSNNVLAIQNDIQIANSYYTVISEISSNNKNVFQEYLDVFPVSYTSIFDIPTYYDLESSTINGEIAGEKAKLTASLNNIAESLQTGLTAHLLKLNSEKDGLSILCSNEETEEEDPPKAVVEEVTNPQAAAPSGEYDTFTFTCLEFYDDEGNVVDVFDVNKDGTIDSEDVEELEEIEENEEKDDTNTGGGINLGPGGVPLGDSDTGEEEGITPTTPVQDNQDDNEKETYPEGDDEITDYGDCSEFGQYEGTIFTLPDGTSLDTRNRQFQDSIGDYPGAFGFSYDVELEVIDSADRDGTCWFFLRALEIYDGDEPEFYTKFSGIQGILAAEACETDLDCEQGFACVEGLCEEIVACETDDDCNEGFSCIDQGCTALDVCESDDDCEEGFYCDEYCFEKHCETDLDCDSGYICNESYECELTEECESDEDCDEGFLCEGNLCVEDVECVEDNDCNAGYACFDSSCTLVCSDDGDCEQGYFCNEFDVCEMSTACDADQDCALGYFCENHICLEDVEYECVEDLDCEQGFLCMENTCVQGCLNNDECDSGFFCEDNACIEGCIDNEDCEDGYACMDNRCEFTCIEDNDCPDNFVCNKDNLCELDDKCDDDLDCELGYYCDENNECVEKITTCTTDADCVPASCCHADSCVLSSEAPDCSGVACTLTCEPGTLDCNQGPCICQNGECLADIGTETSKTILPIIGLYPVTDSSAAEEYNPMALGYFDGTNSADFDADTDLDIFIKLDDRDYERQDEIDYDELNFDEMISTDDNVLGYILIDEPCNPDLWNLEAEDLVQLYEMFEEFNAKIPVIIDFETMGCAQSFFSQTDEQFTDIALFELENPNQDSQAAKNIQQSAGYWVKFIPVIKISENQEIFEAEEVRQLGLSSLKDSFYGIIFEPSAEELNSQVLYRNAFSEVFCEAEEYYYGTACGFEPEVAGDVIIAFTANTGVGEDAQAVLELVEDNDADVLVHLGNLGYDADPEDFALMVEEKLTDRVNFVAVIGQQEFTAGNWDDYENSLSDLYPDLDCTGEYGNQMLCEFESVSIILSGIGTDILTSGHDSFITNSLDNNNEWTICAWHKANKELRVSNKQDNDNLGITYYEYCLNSGAVIATGYDQAYARTTLLTGLTPIAAQNSIDLNQGSIAFVSGLGGYGAEQYSCSMHDTDYWWASIFAPNRHLSSQTDIKDCNNDIVQDFAPGALFITFNYDNDPNRARGEFITIHGDVIDSFEITK